MTKMKKLLLSTFIILGSVLLAGPNLAQTNDSQLKVACVGNSITEGAGLTKTYPDVLQELLGESYEVRNYGIGGRTLLRKGDLPYWNETKYKEVLTWAPDIVIIKLGTNDTKPQNWQYKKEFVTDYVDLINSFKNLPSKPTVLICKPIPVFEDKWGINEAAMDNEVIPAMKKIAEKAQVQIIDVYQPFLEKADLTYDGIHPNDEGAGFLATEIYKALKASKTVVVDR